MDQLAADGSSSADASHKRVAADGEKVSSRQLTSTHVPHPGIGDHFSRSTLVIGSRGAGKTFLLRHRKQTRHRGAIYINLPKALHSIGSDAGIGGRALDFSDEQRTRIRSKSGALIAINALEMCCREVQNDMDLKLTVLDPVLPPILRSRTKTTEISTSKLRGQVGAYELANWTLTAGCAELAEVLEQISERYPLPFALFLDRAEDVPLPSVEVVLKLLDQSVSVLVVVAGRPAIAQLVPTTYDPTFTPGDHYDLVHLGTQPYDPAWIEFSLQATRNYLAENDISMPDGADMMWTSRLARDSIRRAVSFAQIAIDTAGQRLLQERIDQLTRIRALQLKTICADLIPEYKSFREILNHLQREAGPRLATQHQFRLSMEITNRGTQLSMLGEPDRLRDFILRAVRGEALFLPAGQQWHPYELPMQFELAPLLAWDGSNTKWIT